MVISSLTNLCLDLIASAFQRCRLSDNLCRLSVVLKSSPPSNPPIVRISISDTGIGSSMEEFQDLKYNIEGIGAEKWDGLLSVRTTSICDNEMYNYHLNFRESISSRRLVCLPSNPKNGATFSGTEVCLSLLERIDHLVTEINLFFRKMLILNIPNIAIELVVEHGDIPGSRSENVFLANQGNHLPFSTSNVELLKSGLEGYVLKHGKSLNQKCYLCFPTMDHLKLGSGTACSKESHRNSGLMMEVAIIISKYEANCPCFTACNSRTEVLYFKDFKPSSISQSVLKALTGIDWKSYGLTVRNTEDEGGCLMEWENLPPQAHIDIVLHFYHKQGLTTSTRRKSQPDRNLVKRAVTRALNNLKEKHPGILLSEHALKIRGYAPDLARSIAGIILSSNDPEFQGECLSLLGLQSRDVGGESVEDCIKGKIISVIETSDRKSQRSKEVAPLLFEDDGWDDSSFQEKEFRESEDDEGEEAFSYLD